jgi:hypothetical protein
MDMGISLSHKANTLPVRARGTLLKIIKISLRLPKAIKSRHKSAARQSPQ